MTSVRQRHPITSFQKWARLERNAQVIRSKFTVSSPFQLHYLFHFISRPLDAAIALASDFSRSRNSTKSHGRFPPSYSRPFAFAFARWPHALIRPRARSRRPWPRPRAGAQAGESSQPPALSRRDDDRPRGRDRQGDREHRRGLIERPHVVAHHDDTVADDIVADDTAAGGRQRERLVVASLQLGIDPSTT